MTAEASTQVAQPVAAPIAPARSPKTFSGETYDDVNDWVEHYERIARFNNWSDDQKLINVYFSLEGTAKTWFENREISLTSWDVFKRKLCEAFAFSQRSERFEQLLQGRIQLPNESVTGFVEDVPLRVCPGNLPKMIRGNITPVVF